MRHGEEHPAMKGRGSRPPTPGVEMGAAKPPRGEKVLEVLGAWQKLVLEGVSD